MDPGDDQEEGRAGGPDLAPPHLDRRRSSQLGDRYYARAGVLWPHVYIRASGPGLDNDRSVGSICSYVLIMAPMSSSLNPIMFRIAVIAFM